MSRVSVNRRKRSLPNVTNDLDRSQITVTDSQPHVDRRGNTMGDVAKQRTLVQCTRKRRDCHESTCHTNAAYNRYAGTNRSMTCRISNNVVYSGSVFNKTSRALPDSRGRSTLNRREVNLPRRLSAYTEESLNKGNKVSFASNKYSLKNVRTHGSSTQDSRYHSLAFNDARCDNEAIPELPFMSLNVENIRLPFLLDSGSTYNMMSVDTYRQHAEHFPPMEMLSRFSCHAANDSPVKVLGVLFLKFHLNDETTMQKCVVADVKFNILGIDFFHKSNYGLQIHKGQAQLINHFCGTAPPVNDENKPFEAGRSVKHNMVSASVQTMLVLGEASEPPDSNSFKPSNDKSVSENQRSPILQSSKFSDEEFLRLAELVKEHNNRSSEKLAEKIIPIDSSRKKVVRVKKMQKTKTKPHLVDISNQYPELESSHVEVESSSHDSLVSSKHDSVSTYF